MITCEKLSRYYGKNDTQVAAVDHVSFSISRGEQVAITGKSGCGKSTLINLLATIDQPTSGTYRFSDTDVTRLNENQRVDLRRHHISVIFQQYNLIRDLTAQENILLPFHFSKRKIDKALYHRLLETLNLSDRLHHLPDQLSGGQQQRVAICRALITQPELVLADEPTGNLDTSTSQDVMNAIQESCQAYGQTLVLVTHDVEIAHKLNRVIQMSDGRIVSDQLCSRKD